MFSCDDSTRWARYRLGSSFVGIATISVGFLKIFQQKQNYYYFYFIFYIPFSVSDDACVVLTVKGARDHYRM